jgi:hypothetical protein
MTSPFIKKELMDCDRNTMAAHESVFSGSP